MVQISLQDKTAEALTRLATAQGMSLEQYLETLADRVVIEKILIDTGPLVAQFSVRDQYHSICPKTLEQLATPLYTCSPVLVETANILRKYPARQRDLFRSCGAGSTQKTDRTNQP